MTELNHIHTVFSSTYIPLITSKFMKSRHSKKLTITNNNTEIIITKYSTKSYANTISLFQNTVLGCTHLCGDVR